jgi:hypothetical protein
VAFTSVGRTGATGGVACARRWIWRSQCILQLLLHVVDDQVLEVVDVPLVGLNGWGIHPLQETAVVCLVGVLEKKQENISKAKNMMNKFHVHCLPMLVRSAKNDDRSCSIPGRC